MKERIKEKGLAKKIERGRKLVIMAAFAKMNEMSDGEIAGEPFVVFTSEMAESLLKLAHSLGLFINFVVSYKENDRIKYSVLEHIENDEIVLFEPEGGYESRIALDQFKREWGKTDKWTMMVPKEGSRI